MESDRHAPCTSSLCVLDNFLSLVVVSTLVVSYWRGCWQLMDLFLFSGNPKLSVYSSLIIGVVPGMIFCLLQQQLERVLDVNKRPFLYGLGSRLYTVIYSITCVNHWRGVWQLWDVYTGTSWQSGAISTALGIFILIITRGLKNILAPPFVICPDTPEGYFHVPTLFGAQKSSLGTRLLDAFFTVVITGSLVVFVWRGGWVLLDRLLFPHQPAASAIGSMVLGIVASLVAFSCQGALACYLRPLGKGWRKIILEDVYNTFCFFATVNVWRGVWAGLNVFFLKENPVASNMVTAVVGQVLLTVFFCANSLLVRGAIMDGSQTGADGVTFSTAYIRYFRKKRLEEIAKDQDFWSKERTDSKEESSSACDQFNKYNGGACGPGSQESEGQQTHKCDGWDQQRSMAEKGINCSQDDPENVSMRLTKENRTKSSGGSGSVSRERNCSTESKETFADLTASGKGACDEQANRYDVGGNPTEKDFKYNETEATEKSHKNGSADQEIHSSFNSECSKANPSVKYREKGLQTHVVQEETQL